MKELWHAFCYDVMLEIKFVFYMIFVVFFIVGIYLLFAGAPGLGVVLMLINAGLFVLLLRFDKKQAQKDDADFEAMVRRNRGES